jgi:hypothetical protein
MDGRQTLIRKADGKGIPLQKPSEETAENPGIRLGGFARSDDITSNRTAEISGGKLFHSSQQGSDAGQDGGVRDAVASNRKYQEMKLAYEKRFVPRSAFPRYIKEDC